MLQEVRQCFLLRDYIHEWAVTVTRELDTGGLVCTISLSLLASLENIRHQENSPQSVGVWLGSAKETRTGEFPAQMASNAENDSIWWRHHGIIRCCVMSICFQQAVPHTIVHVSHKFLWYRASLRPSDAYIFVEDLTIIGSDSGLSPDRCQATIWIDAGILLIGPLGTKFSEILMEIHTFSFKKMHWKRRLENSGHFVSASMR